MTLANTFAPTNSTTQTWPSWQSAIDSNSQALAAVAGQFQPTVDGLTLKVYLGAGAIPTSAGVTAVAAQSVTLAAAPASNSRIDLVVVDRLTGAASAIAGTAAASPTAPACPAGKLPIAQITVAAGTAALTNAMGVDVRTTWCPALGSAAFLPAGSAAGSVLLLGANIGGNPALGACDGSQLTGLPAAVTVAQFTALQQDVIQNYLLDAINGGWAAGWYSNGGYDAFNSDTLSGVSGTSGQTYDGTNKLYSNLAYTTTTTSIPQYGNSLSGYLIVDRSYSIPNSVTVKSIGVYSTSSTTVELKIMRRNSAGNYTCVVSQNISHSGGGWQDLTLTPPYSILSSGLYYIGAYCGSVIIGNEQANGYQQGELNGNVAQGNSSGSFGEGTAYAAFLTRFSYQNGTTNMTLVTAPLNPAPATAPSKAQVMVLWKDNSGGAALNTDFTAEVTANGGANWVTGTLADIGITMAGGYHLLATTVTLSSGGTTVQARIRTLNNKAQLVKAVSVMTL
jgi:hypothetical protein